MKNPGPEKRSELVRILREIKADVAELRALVEASASTPRELEP